jgi:hypothetical protein
MGDWLGWCDNLFIYPVCSERLAFASNIFKEWGIFSDEGFLNSLYSFDKLLIRLAFENEEGLEICFLHSNCLHQSCFDD